MIVLLLALLLLAAPAWAAPTLPTPPAVYNPSFSTAGYNVYGPVSASGIQAHLNNLGTASGGHGVNDLTTGVVIKVTAGTSTDQINLPFKNMTAGKYIFIRPDDAAFAALPDGTRTTLSVSGTRVQASNAGNMWQLRPTSGQNCAICTDMATNAAANSYWIYGVEVMNGAGTGVGTNAWNLVAFGMRQDGSVPTSVAMAPKNMVLDHSYVRGSGTASGSRNAVILHCGNGTPAGGCAVINNFIGPIWYDSTTESHGVWMNEAPGPLRIENNEVIDASILIFSAGVGQSIGDNTVPHDVTVRRNYLHRTPSTRNAGPFQKGAVEFKRGQRILIENNVILNIWRDTNTDQDGSSIVLTVRSESQAAARLDDIEVRWNKATSTCHGVQAVARDNFGLGDERASRLYVHDNVIEDVSRAWGCDPQRGFASAWQGYDDVTYDHNTALLIGSDTDQGFFRGGFLSGPAATGFAYTNNLHSMRDDGFVVFDQPNNNCQNMTTLLNAIYNAAPRSWVVTNNILVPGNCTPAGIPAGNITSVTNAQYTGTSFFVAFTGGNGGNYALQAGQPGQTTHATIFGRTWGVGANDGTDIGISSYPTLVTKITGVVAGAPESGGGDTTAPTIAITTPTSSPTYAITQTTVALAGTAADAVGVTGVTWVNARGGSGTATGTTSWSIPTVTLLAGSNVITVTASDAAGNLGNAQLTVTFTPGLTWQGSSSDRRR